MVATFVPKVQSCANFHSPAYSDEFKYVSYNLGERQISVMIIKTPLHQEINASENILTKYRPFCFP